MTVRYNRVLGYRLYIQGGVYFVFGLFISSGGGLSVQRQGAFRILKEYVILGTNLPPLITLYFDYDRFSKLPKYLSFCLTVYGGGGIGRVGKAPRNTVVSS